MWARHAPEELLRQHEAYLTAAEAGGQSLSLARARAERFEREAAETRARHRRRARKGA